MIKSTRITFQTTGDPSVGMFPIEVTVDVSAILDQADAEDFAQEIADYLDEGPVTDIDVTHVEEGSLTDIERLRAENANLKRLLDDANERAAQIEDWQIKCALLEVDRDKARAENAALAGERDRLREALEGMWAEEVESIIVGFTNKQPVYGDAYCRRCNARASKQANIVHRNDCPFAVLNEEPTDGE